MTTLEQAARLVLEALEEVHPGNMTPMAEEAWNKAITALRSALEQPQQELDPAARNGWVLREVLFDNGEPVGHREPQQEPVAWLVESKHGNWAPYLEWSEPSYLETQVVTPLYTSPTASKPWVGLNAKDLAEIPPSCFEGAIWADAKLKEKNNG